MSLEHCPSTRTTIWSAKAACGFRYAPCSTAIGKSLAAVGAQRSDVVRTKTYVTDMAAYLREGHQEYLSFFGDKLPVSTTVGVTVLADTRCLVEIEAYAETE